MVRKNNEDYCQIVNLPDDVCLFLVADGIGGNAGGEIASQVAVHTVTEALSSTEISDIESCRSHVSHAIEQAHRAVLEKAEREPDMAGMGTTLTMMVIKEDRGLVAHVGDSRAYHYHDGKMSRITDDHSLTEEWVRDGKITPEEAAFHPYRNVLTRAVGIEPFEKPDFVPIHLQSGDRVLICTDGLTNMVDDRRLEEILKLNLDPQTLSERLGQEALNEGGHDNVTMIAVDWAGKKD